MSRVIAAFSQFFKGDGSPLANGYLRFLISQTTSTEKATYADVDQTIPNANPVQLDGEGRCPNVFGQGIYKVVLYDINPVTGLPGMMIQTFDPVVADYQSEGAGGNFAEWESGTIYQIGQIVIYNGLYYRSHIANNVGNQPDISADSWERIDFLRFWNLDVTYGLDDVVIYGSQLYFSLQAGNLNHVPSTSPAWWDPVGSGTVLLNWMESGTAFVPIVSGYDFGSTTNLVGDIYQGDNARHYFGDGQDTALYFDSNDFYITTVGDLIVGTLDASEIILTTQSFARWRIKSDGHLIPDANLDIGGTALPIGDLYQGSNQHLYIGDSQQIDINYDGTDLYTTIGANAWALLTAGHIEPQTDATFNVGSASNRVKQVSVSDNPTLDDHVIRKAYLDSSLSDIDDRIDIIGGKKNLWGGNSGCEIAQRATSQSINGIYSLDRYIFNAISSASQQAITGLPGLNFAFEFGNTISTTPYVDHVILARNMKPLIGKTLTISFWAKNISSNSGLTFQTFYPTSTDDDFATLSAFNTEFIWPDDAPASVFTRYSYSYVITAALSTGLLFRFFRTSTYANAFTQLTGFQFEIGSTATDYEYQSFESALNECLPYFQKTYDYGTALGTITTNGWVHAYIDGVASAGFTQNLEWPYQHPMIKIPQITVYSTGTGASGFVAMPSGDVAPSSIQIGEKSTVISASNGGASTLRYMAYQATADTGY